MKIEFRPYQLECVETLLSCNEPALAVLPCASGKTEIFIEALNRSAGKKSLVVVDQLSLLDQTVERLQRALPTQRIRQFAGSRKKEHFVSDITVASVQSILKDLAIKEFDQIILDEVHMVNFEEKGSRYYKLIEKNPSAKIMGFTATPYRENGYIFGDKKLFKKIHYQKNLKEMIEAGWLVPPILKGSKERFDTSKLKTKFGEYLQSDVSKLVANEEKNIRQIKDALSRNGDRKKIIWFCANIFHAESVYKKLCEVESTAILHSQLPPERQEIEKNLFHETPCRHLVFVTMVSKGYNYPPVDCVVLLRPTKSASLYVQVCGRALRLSPGKKDALILDYGRVIENLGPLDNPLVLEGRPKKKLEGEPVTQMKQCPQCSQMLSNSLMQCPECQYEYPKTEIKLSTKPEEARGILSSSPQLLLEDVFNIEIHPHTSGSGNKCIKIVYNKKRELTEYIPLSPIFQSKVFKRLKSMGIPMIETLTLISADKCIKFPTALSMRYKDKPPYGIDVVELEDVI